jgi:anti-sigma factor RsiW
MQRIGEWRVLPRIPLKNTMTCPTCEPLLAAYADGAISGADRTRVDDHLRACEACREALAVQTTMRRVLLAGGRAAEVSAPPGLRTRIAATLAAEQAPAGAFGWGSRLSAFAAAAVVVLAVGAAALPVVTTHSTVVLAAQMALDHLKCFSLDGHDHGDTIPVAEAERELLQDYGWSLDVPETAGDLAGRLVAVRRCLYGDGRAAHLLYRVNGEPVSLFILPGLERPAETLTLLSQDTVVWADGGRTYVLVGSAGTSPRLEEMASNLRNEAK